MLFLSHVAVGAAIGSAVNNPVLAILLSIVSHYFLDCVPHTDQLFTKNKKLIYIADFVLTIISTILFSVFIPQFINSNHEININAYPFALPTLTIPVLNYTFSPIIFACCLFSILPGLLVIIEKFSKKEIKFLSWNTKLKNIMHNIDNGIMGKVVQFSTFMVFTLYAFRQLPNSESNMFLQIILLMLFIVAILAMLETFSEEYKNKEDEAILLENKKAIRKGKVI
jgi:hypothetical protein